MDKADKIVKAFAAGAAANFRPNRWRENLVMEPLNEARQDLVNYAKETYPAVDFDILDHAPGQPDRQEMLRKALVEAEADQDETLIKKVDELLFHIKDLEPGALTAAEPIDPE